MIFMQASDVFFHDFTSWYDKNQKKTFQDFFHFLAFPTVSARSESLPALKKCAQFLKQEYEAIDYKCTIVETNFAPCLIVEKMINPAYETVLFYNHYDVQPEEPLELWNSNPFQAVIKDEAVYARGAEDNKGQCFYVLTALKAIHDLKKQPKVNIKVIIEGEEEVGSTHLSHVLDSESARLKADHLFVVDSGMKSLDHPVIGIGARGVLTYELSIKTANTDLHSGEHGGITYSATRAIVDVLAKCFDKNGKVVIPGFYDQVKKYHLDPNLYDIGFDKEDYIKTFGTKVFANLPETSVVESNWLYPTLEINGIYGGYAGEGFKTVLPAQAMAKLSIRTVPNQDPVKLTESLKEFFQKNLHPEIEWDLKIHGLGDYVVSSPDYKCVKVAQKAYSDVFGKPCKFSLCGGSIPITAKLAKATGSQPVLIGTGLIDDNIHAPNERFRIESFKKGFLTIARILDILDKTT
jgi:acetylornithine deacetylase/succinyl-diaminopimelate desuccinylase-like protein